MSTELTDHGFLNLYQLLQAVILSVRNVGGSAMGAGLVATIQHLQTDSVFAVACPQVLCCCGVVDVAQVAAVGHDLLEGGLELGATVVPRL